VASGAAEVVGADVGTLPAQADKALITTQAAIGGAQDQEFW
jgi:hypothetical protein